MELYKSCSRLLTCQRREDTPRKYTSTYARTTAEIPSGTLPLDQLLISLTIDSILTLQQALLQRYRLYYGIGFKGKTYIYIFIYLFIYLFIRQLFGQRRRNFTERQQDNQYIHTHTHTHTHTHIKVTLSCVRVTSVAVLHILGVCLQPYLSSMQSACAVLYSHL